jgi:hypothetical protein
MTISAADFRDIEIVERDAWLDLYAAAPPDAAAELGLAYALKGDAALLIMRSLDALTFNRLACLGVASPPRPEVLDETIAAFEAAGVRNWVVQVPEGEKSLEALCNARDLVPHRRVWAKFIRRPGVVTAQTSLEVRMIGREQAPAFGEIAAAARRGCVAVGARWPASLDLLHGVRWRDAGRNGSAFRGRHIGLARRRGSACGLSPAGRAVRSLAARINYATANGVRILTTETGVPHPGESGPSYGNIQRAGFGIAYLRPNFCRAAG